MTDKRDKDLAKSIMQHFGISLQDIPRASALTPDFEFSLGNERYLVEMKTKGDDPEALEKFRQGLDKGGIVQESSPILPRNTLSSVIEEGVQQTAAQDPSRQAFRIVWLYCAGRDPQLHWERFFSTLYGAENLTSLELKSLAYCYYFYDSAFFRFKNDLDAAILTNSKSIKLCINSLSVKAEEFQKSALVEVLSNGLCNPPREEARTAGVMIADCDLDRKNTAAVLEYLKSKYKLTHLQVMTMNQFSGTMKIPE